jgi:anti-sigma regulatory factor (Ser/Thr protein kinase)
MHPYLPDAHDMPPPAPALARPEARGLVSLPIRTNRHRPGPAARTTSLTVGPVDTAPACARATVRDALAQWRLRHLTDDAEAITSEIVANAIAASKRAAPPGTAPAAVTLWLTVRDAELCIRVQDPDPAPPPRPRRPPDDDAEHGRGLLIVDALASRWGWYPAATGGKYVWAALTTEALPPAG